MSQRRSRERSGYAGKDRVQDRVGKIGESMSLGDSSPGGHKTSRGHCGCGARQMTQSPGLTKDFGAPS